MQGGGQGQGVVVAQAGGDGGVQMHQLAVAGQARMAGPARLQARLAQFGCDRLHHQLVFVAVLDGGEQVVGGGPERGGAGQGIAAQLLLAHAQQPLRRGPHQGGAIALVPEEAAAARLAQAQLGQELERIEGRIELDLLAHRQHQLAQHARLDQLQTPFGGSAVAGLPGGAAGPGRAAALAERSAQLWVGPGDQVRFGASVRASAALPVPTRRRLGCQGLQALGLLPQLLGHGPGCHLAAQVALQPQPAMAALAAQLPAGQHGPHPGHAAALLQGAIKKGKGQQHPGPGQGRTGLGGGQAAEADGAEPLGQLKAARTAQLQDVGAAAGGQAQARGAVPQAAKATGLGQGVQDRQGIEFRQGQGQAEHPLAVELALALGRGIQQRREAQGLDSGGARMVDQRFDRQKAWDSLAQVFPWQRPHGGALTRGGLGSAAQMYGSFLA